MRTIRASTRASSATDASTVTTRPTNSRAKPSPRQVRAQSPPRCGIASLPRVESVLYFLLVEAHANTAGNISAPGITIENHLFGSKWTVAPTEIKCRLRVDTENAIQWFINYGMKANAEQFNMMFINAVKNNGPFPLSITVEDVNIARRGDARLLGVTFEQGT